MGRLGMRAPAPPSPRQTWHDPPSLRLSAAPDSAPDTRIIKNRGGRGREAGRRGGEGAEIGRAGEERDIGGLEGGRGGGGAGLREGGKVTEGEKGG
jgi:hypothetical protein